MGKVLEFKLPEKDDPHISGPALCLACKHEWVAVAPVGTEWMECPECHGEKGFFKWPCERQGEEHWKCNCGCWFFAMVRDGIYCPGCGSWQAGF